MKLKELSITNIPEISAIYYALLQCGYDFYEIERDKHTVDRLRGFAQPDGAEYGFFSGTRQNTCEVYPYWPRAALLESAVFRLDSRAARFTDFDGYRSFVLSAENIADGERDAAFWDWVRHFPEALRYVMEGGGFRRYIAWENEWAAEQNREHGSALKRLGDVLTLCGERFGTPLKSVSIVLSPIKCVYSSDYHIKNGDFIFSSGAFREESVVHEFLHRSVHPKTEERRDEILRREAVYPDLDASYLLDGGEVGRLNAFEEYAVRKLTEMLIGGSVPESLDTFFDEELAE